MWIVSACLLGTKCRYDGGDNFIPWLKEFLKGKKVLPICPEGQGGLPIPRPPAEQVIGEDGLLRVFNKEGEDVTDAFFKGAWDAYEMAMSRGKIEGAILKANSPSCGKDKIYDGSFSKCKIKGSGIFASMLLKEGIVVFTEEEETAVKEWARREKEE